MLWDEEREMDDEETVTVIGNHILTGNKWTKDRESEIIKVYLWIQMKQQNWYWCLKTRKTHEIKMTSSTRGLWVNMSRNGWVHRTTPLNWGENSQRRIETLSLKLKIGITNLFGTVTQCLWVWDLESDTYRLKFWLCHYMTFGKSFHFLKPFFFTCKMGIIMSLHRMNTGNKSINF